ncbi:sialate O-acetylesterase [Pelagicoccus mobilis]|uniref:Sialate O-acetylesterase domain-containing protein n=1 Tax=Pelagicoccus mobilis TaxID=415221 RepID=A0A934RX04_9BACT|nr:sialate O-acetylesterase [Pelagicoccus mobilis]MBK1878342.1 hypothetical protein [Pelagicoccus mobilis]
MKAFLLLFATTICPLLHALELASPFGDHMVLQRQIRLPIWGTAAPGEKVTVTFANQNVSTRADAGGDWKIKLTPIPASPEGRPFTVSGNQSKTNITLLDVLVGDVWLCGGQSNMERQLGPRSGQPDIYNWQAEASSANYPQIRELYVQQTLSHTPQTRVDAKWRVCSPDTVEDFTAVGYYFARDLHLSQDVPIGIIHSSWGGTPAQAWTGKEGLSEFPHYLAESKRLQEHATEPERARAEHEKSVNAWYQQHDLGTREQWWQDTTSPEWQSMQLPNMWEDQGHDGIDGIAWFEKRFEIPTLWAEQPLVLELGAIDDVDTTWINGHKLGSTTGWQTLRRYEIAPQILKPGSNTIRVRVLDTGGGGGIWDPQTPLQISPKVNPTEAIDLAGSWNYKFSHIFTDGPRPPQDTTNTPGAATVLYNGMIAPLIPYSIKGVAFYQGEANAGNATEYQTLLPALITDWRKRWALGDFPFLFVQIAPFEGMPPEIREAQRLAQLATPNTAMAVTIDVGDALDIHPANKEPVGQRLALAARSLAYGDDIIYSGPTLIEATRRGSQAILTFDNAANGLVAPGGQAIGFELAGPDGIFHIAKAQIHPSKITLESERVPEPKLVRYAWSNVPEGNLYNSEGLPASPFQTQTSP